MRDIIPFRLKVKKARGDGYDYVGEDGAYDAFRSSIPFRDKNQIEIVE